MVYMGVPAPAGEQYVELDANSPDTLWQTARLAPGAAQYWSFLHRGRNGIESVELSIGPPMPRPRKACLPAPKMLGIRTGHLCGGNDRSRHALRARFAHGPCPRQLGRRRPSRACRLSCAGYSELSRASSARTRGKWIDSGTCFERAGSTGRLVVWPARASASSMITSRSTASAPPGKRR